MADEGLIELFARFGTTQSLPESEILSLEAFVCQLYGKPLSKSVDKLRFDKVRQSFTSKRKVLSDKTGLDFSQLPPCRNVLLLHIQRANFQTMIWRRSSFQQPDLPSANCNGWISDGSGILDIKWYSGSFLPDELEDIVPDDINEEVDTDIESDDSAEDSDTENSEYSDSDTENDI